MSAREKWAVFLELYNSGASNANTQDVKNEQALMPSKNTYFCQMK